jgi:hypothetical protein
VQKNVNFTAAGRYIQIRTRLQTNPTNETPVLYDLTVNSRVAACDIDQDGDVDSADVVLVRQAIGQSVAAGDPRDPTGDGRVTINDVRACTLQCTRNACATQ